VHAAIEGGINFIDVSPYYGHTKAETVLGKALRNVPRDNIIWHQSRTLRRKRVRLFRRTRHTQRG
jgi:predicted aldo/keto reductase-like oxidoreductase